MSVQFTDLDAIIKETYLPAWDNQLGVTPAAIMQKIKKVPLSGAEIVAGARVGLNGGFGFGIDGSGIPSAGQRQYQQFKTDVKDMYCEIKITDKTMKLAQGKSDSILNVLDDEIKGSYEAAEWNIGRAVFGNGSGKLTTFTAPVESVETVTVDSVQFLKEGLKVDLYAAADITPAQTLQIAAIDRANSTVTFSEKVDASEYSSNTNFMTVQKSFSHELTGLGAIFDTTNVTELYGVSRTAYPYLNPISISANHKLTDVTINNVIRQAEREKNSKINFLCMGDNAYDAYITYLRNTNRRIDETNNLEGGFKGIRFLFGNREVEIVNEQFVDPNTVWGFDTDKLELHTLNWDFMTKDGGAFNLMEGTSIFRALLVNYGDLICTNPGGCIEITNADAQEEEYDIYINADTVNVNTDEEETGGSSSGGSGNAG